MKITTVDEMREMDRTAIETYGIADEILMENAGIAAYTVIANDHQIKGSKFALFCGGGNNGGDGFVVARKLYSMGGNVVLFLMSDPERLRGAAKKKFDILVKLNLSVILVESAKHVRDRIDEFDLIVDAIFGTGLSRDVEGVYKEIIQIINESRKPVYSIDIPSGVNGNTGMIQGTAVRASTTVTFGAPKRGNLLYPGYEYTGVLWVTRISFPPSLYDSGKIKVEINEPLPLPKRPIDSHKGDFGDVLFIAGAHYYYGAPYFAAFSFLKSGGGYARLAAPASIVPFIATRGSEIVFVPQKETESGTISLENSKALIELSRLVDLVVIGPGLSRDDETQQLVRVLVSSIEKPILIDGDGITAISSDLSVLKNRSIPTVLTPHMGEMARIIGNSVEEIKRRRIETLQRTAKDTGAIIVLKGAHSLVGFPDGRVAINLSGNSGMATAGSGDLLTGTIAAMYGLGLSLEEAVKTGVFIHGFAGDQAAEVEGEDGITAYTILEHLPLSVKVLRDSYDKITENYYHKIHLV